MRLVYTMWGQKIAPFYFCKNFVKPHYISIICGEQILKWIFNKSATELPTSPDGCFYPTLWNIVCHSVNNHSLSVMHNDTSVSDKCILEWLSISGSLQDWGLFYWEAAWSPESCITAARCSCARVVHWKVKLTSSLTDVWQQLFEQQDITVIVLCIIHFYPWLHENDTSAPAPGDTDWNQRGMSMRWNGTWFKYGQQLADQSIDQWRDCFIACLKAKSKHFEHLLWCVCLCYVTVMT